MAKTLDVGDVELIAVAALVVAFGYVTYEAVQGTGSVFAGLKKWFNDTFGSATTGQGDDANTPVLSSQEGALAIAKHETINEADPSTLSSIYQSMHPSDPPPLIGSN